VTPVFVRGGFADVTPAGLTILAEEAVRLSDVERWVAGREIAKVRSDANDPGDEAPQDARGGTACVSRGAKAARRPSRKGQFNSIAWSGSA
jgi:F-type H+-transporting ATPase subunit epsilon